MAQEKVTRKTEKTLNKNDLRSISEYLQGEAEDRKGRRNDLERHWTEIDRQVAMEPMAREVRSGEKKDWYPDLELPLQFNALEVIAADARRLKFPRGTDWFSCAAEISDKYLERWQNNRDKRPLLAGGGFSNLPDSPEKRLAQQIDLDQETANLMCKVVMDHYHRQYDFRTQMDLFDTEMIKYGTGVVRVRPVKTSKFSLDFRGGKSDGAMGPAVIPCSIWNTYLDDSSNAVMHEGVAIAPLTLRTGRQRLDSLLLAAKKGGKERGWLPAQLNNLKPIDRARNVDIIEGEGDFVIPRTRGSIYLPNFLITIAVGQGDSRVIRMRENPTPFRSYVSGTYMRDDLKSPYGSSPLMKGQPIQEAATEVFNDLLAAARLNADPVVVYDRFDQNFAGGGGPDIFPGSLIAADSPNAVEDLKIGNLGDLTNAYLALLKEYEDLTGVNDARRGAPVKSHTTTGGVELEASRGISRTDDFVEGVEQGPLRTILYMEWEIIKSIMKTPQPISVASGGIEGWVQLAASDLPDNMVFHVHGSSGALNERERAANFAQASQFILQMAPLAQQLGQPIPLNFIEIATEAYTRAGVQNASRFIGDTTNNSGQPAPAAAVPSPDEGAAEDFIASLGGGAV